MEHPELSIAVSSFNGNPMLSVRGIMDGWHAPAVEEAVHSFFGSGAILTLDISDLKFAEVEGASALVKMLRSLRPELRIYAIAQGQLSNLLKKAESGSCIKVFGSLDEAAEAARAEPDYTTSHWLTHTDDVELPLAA